MHNQPGQVIRAVGALFLSVIIATPSSTAVAQDTGRGGRGGGRGGPPVVMDSARARQLYVSNRPEDHPQPNFDQQIQQRMVAESTTVAKSRGVLEYTTIKYKSGVDGMEIPASLYQPLQKRGPRGHAAMVWVHGGVHGSWWSYRLLPFVKEAIQRGYVIIAPEYRGSTGFGAAHYNAIDYGGKELDDVVSAVEYLKTFAVRRPGADRNHGMEPWCYITSPCSSASSIRSRRARRWYRSPTLFSV
jgi:hypothetical protein